MSPLFSVVIPCYNASETISQCLGSIVDQDFKDYEIICVLDGKDEITESMAVLFDKVKCVTIEHGGACKARNKGLELAQGKYVLFSDADVVWEPGIFRTMKEKFEETGADFLFGGYRWMDRDGGHIPPEFNAHLLTVANYIDSGSPVKTELARKINGWDESLERFQDWDFFLRVVKAGGIGVRIPDNLKKQYFPKDGDISAKDNYEETYRIVRKKHGIDRKICLATIGASRHTLRIAELCDWDYWPDPSMLPNNYDAVYMIGCFPESIDEHVSLFYDYGRKKIRTGKLLIHWIGTDILHMRMNVPFLQIKSMRESFKKQNVVHFTQSKVNVEEMEEIGFEVKHLPLPVQMKQFKAPLPEQFTIACYDHEGQDQKWHKWLITEVAKATPDVKFVFFGDKNRVGVSGNTEWLGIVKPDDVIKKASCLLRLTIHDGYPVSVVEFLISGRRVITNVKDMPMTDFMELGLISEERIEELKGMLINKIREVQDADPINGDDALDHYSEMLDPKKFKKTIEAIVYEQDRSDYENESKN